MDDNDLELLKDSINKVVTIQCVDGEILSAKVLVVSDEDEDIIFDLVSTNSESKYEKLDTQPAYLLRFRHIARVSSTD